MKSRDLLYLAVIGGLGYLLYKNNKKKSNGTNVGSNNEVTPEPSVESYSELTFSIPSSVKGESTKYSSENGKYYAQPMGASIRSVRSEITLSEFKDAYAKFKALPIGLNTKSKSEVMPLLGGNAVVEAVSNFSGTLYRGVM